MLSSFLNKPQLMSSLQPPFAAGPVGQSYQRQPEHFQYGPPQDLGNRAQFSASRYRRGDGRPNHQGRVGFASHRSDDRGYNRNRYGHHHQGHTPDFRVQHLTHSNSPDPSASHLSAHQPPRPRPQYDATMLPQSRSRDDGDPYDKFDRCEASQNAFQTDNLTITNSDHPPNGVPQSDFHDSAHVSLPHTPSARTCSPGRYEDSDKEYLMIRERTKEQDTFHAFAPQDDDKNNGRTNGQDTSQGSRAHFEDNVRTKTPSLRDAPREEREWSSATAQDAYPGNRRGPPPRQYERAPQGHGHYFRDRPRPRR
jgi:hypothetical protein